MCTLAYIGSKVWKQRLILCFLPHVFRDAKEKNYFSPICKLRFRNIGNTTFVT